MTRIVLASGSSARRSMLAAAGVRFEAVVSTVDEDDVKARGGTARDIAETLARLKAMAGRRPATLVIGADQTLELDGHSISKAASVEELRANLLRLRGRTHALHSAVAVAEDDTILWSHTETARLTMRDFSDGFLDDYISRNGEAVRSSLGGYWFEGEGAQLFDRVDGDYFTVLGLPLIPLLGFLRREGVLPS